MASTVLKDVGIWIDGRDFSGVTNEVSGPELSVDTPEDTTFRPAGGYRTFATGGLKASALSMGGFFDGALSNDAAHFDALATQNTVMLTPAGVSAGEVAYVVPVTTSAHSLGGSVGDLEAFSYAAAGREVVHRASILDVRTGAATTITSPFRTLPTIASGDELIVWAHVQVEGGGHVNLELRSRPTPTTGTQTQRAIRLGITDTGLYELRVHGPITDTAWHMLYAIAGGPPSPDFDFAVAVNTAAIVVIPAPPIIPPTPATHTLLGGLSADATPISSEINIDPVSGQAGRINFGSFANRHVLIWRDVAQGDITSVIVHNDPTHQNQIGGWTKFPTQVNVTGTNGSVWVSDQALTAATDFVLDIS